MKFFNGKIAALGGLVLGTAQNPAAELNASGGEAGKLVGAQVPPYLVVAAAAGGIPSWKPKTVYGLNVLVENLGVTYICIEAHESGETFSGVGAHWSILAGSSVKFVCVAPTGIAATDTANAKAVLKKAGEEKGIAVFDHPVNYIINEELVRPAEASVIITPGTVLKAASPFTGAAVLSDPPSERTVRRAITGGGTVDANGVVGNAVWLRYYGDLVYGIHACNSTKDDLRLGDKVTPAPGNSFNIKMTADCGVHRTVAGSSPVGFSCIHAEWATDGRAPGEISCVGQETGIKLDKASGGWKIVGAHPQSSSQYPMAVNIEDNSGCEWVAPHCDTPQPQKHVGATGSAASSTITDSEILEQHQGRAVRGEGIPANSFVGKVTPGVSFQLQNETRVEIKPTGEVKGIELPGIGLFISENGARVLGGISVLNTGPLPVDNANYGLLTSPEVTSGWVGGFYAKGLPGQRFIQAMGGRLSKLTWIGLIQTNCVTEIAPLRFPEESIGTAEIAKEAITSEKIAAGAFTIGAEAVTTEKIKKEAVTEEKIANGAVTESKIGTEAVSSAKIKLLAVTEGKLANGAVGTEKLAAEAVATGKIKLLAVTTGILAEGAVSEEKIKALAVAEGKIAAEAVSSGKIKKEAVTEEKIAPNAVVESKIGGEAVATAKIKNEAVTAAKLATGAVTEEKIGAEAVVSGKIKKETIQSDRVKPAVTPAASGEENVVVVGSAGIGRKVVAAITGNGIATSFKIKHNLESRALLSTILTSTFEEPVTMLAKVTGVSLSEAEVTFTLAPAAKAVNYVVIVA